MGPIEALERSRAVEIRRRLYAPKVMKEATGPRVVVRREARQIEPVPTPPEMVADEAAIQPDPINVVAPDAVIETRRETIRRIVSECSQLHGVSAADVLGFDRRKATVGARQHAMFRLQVELDMSFCAIGLALNRTHATVIHGIGIHVDRNPSDAIVAQRHAETVRARAEQDRQLAIAAYAAGQITFTQAASLLRMSRPKARRMLVEQGIIPAQDANGNP